MALRLLGRLSVTVATAFSMLTVTVFVSDMMILAC
jgi:hypothetical protein